MANVLDSVFAWAEQQWSANPMANLTVDLGVTLNLLSDATDGNNAGANTNLVGSGAGRLTFMGAKDPPFSRATGTFQTQAPVPISFVIFDTIPGTDQLTAAITPPNRQELHSTYAITIRSQTVTGSFNPTVDPTTGVLWGVIGSTFVTISLAHWAVDGTA